MASLKKCVEAKCKDCTYDHAAPGTWREQVEQCTVTRCPLWVVRPMTVATINANRKVLAETAGLDIDALIAGLDDEDEEASVADAVA